MSLVYKRGKIEFQASKEGNFPFEMKTDGGSLKCLNVDQKCARVEAPPLICARFEKDAY